MSVIASTTPLAALYATVLLAACGAQMRPRPRGQDCIAYDLSFRQAHLGNGAWAAPEFLGFADPAHGLEGAYAACPAGPPDPALRTAFESYVEEAAKHEQGNYFTGYNGELPASSAQVIHFDPSGPDRTEGAEGALYRYRTYHAFFQGCLFKTLSMSPLGRAEECSAGVGPTAAR